MKRFNYIYFIFIILAYSCLDGVDIPTDVKNGKLASVEAFDLKPSDITYATAIFYGKIVSGNGYQIQSRGFIYSLSSDLKNGTKVEVPLEHGTGTFTNQVVGLESSKTYYYGSFATSEKGTNYSNIIAFTTLSEYPIITTQAIKNENIKDGTITCYGIIVSEGAAPIDSCGFCWSRINANPSLSSGDNITYSNDISGMFEMSFTQLKGGETYYFRTFAKNSYGIQYGEIVTAVTPPIWEMLSAFVGPGRIGAATFTIGYNFYVVAGDASSYTLNDNWEYSVPSPSWSQRQTFPGVSRKAPCSFVIGNKGYVGLGAAGGGGSPLSDFFYYDQSTNEWSEIETPFGKLQDAKPRSFAIGLSLNNKGYTIGGQIPIIGTFNFEAVADIWEYDELKNSWEQKISFPELISAGVGFTVGNRGFVGFGYQPRKKRYNKIWEWKYKETPIRWDVVATAPDDLYLDNGITGVTVVEKTAYFIDGNNRIWALDLDDFTWSKKSNMPVLQSPNQSMFSYNHSIYIGLNQYSKFFYQYRPYWDN